MTEFFSYSIIGVTYGAIYAIGATGLVLTFTTSRIFNLAHGAIGLIVAFLYYQLWIEWHVPEVPSLLITVFVIGPGLGWILGDLIMRHLARTAVTLRLMGTLSLFVLFQGLATVVWERDGQVRSLPQIVPGTGFRIGRVDVSWSQFVTVLLALAVAVLLWLFLHRTRLGTAMRAVVDNPDLAELMAISPNRVQNVSWGIGVSLAGLAAILIAPDLGGLQQITVLSLLVISSFAAAIVGRLANIGMTYVGGLILGIVVSLLPSYLPSSNQVVQDLPQAMPFILLFVVLIAMRQEQQALQRQTGLLADAPPPIWETVSWCVVAIVGSLILAPHLSQFMSLVVATGLVYTAILLSLVLLTGMAGQVSLCQFSFVGIGAALVTHLAHHMPYAIAALVATILTGLVGALIALPALRMRSLYIALATFAFALMCDDLLFQNSHVFGALGQAVVAPAPSIFGLTAHGNKSFMVVGAVLVSVFALGIQLTRRGRFGRRLAALRDSTPAAAALGLSVVRTKVVVFGLSAAMAGLAGCIYGGLIGVVGGSEFTFMLSLTALLILAIQGLTAVPGAVVGGIFYALLYLLVPQWIHQEWIVEILQPAGVGLAVISVIQHPEGAWTFQARAVRALREGHRKPAPVPAVGLASAGRRRPTSVGER